MAVCFLCDKQSAKSKHGGPHDFLEKQGENRTFSNQLKKGYEEQDYQCQTCQSTFTFSTNKNDMAWTLWQG
jgi:hypothetical protein